MNRALFQIASLDCPGCGRNIEDKLSKLSGVTSVKVFPGLGRIRIEFDETITNAESISNIIRSWGHAAELKKITKEA